MIDNYLDVHASALHLRSRRTKILASNIANADTPGYKAKDLAFAEVLRDTSGNINAETKLSKAQLNTTNNRHIRTLGSTSEARVMYRQPQEAALDGNTVDKDLEQARFAENTVRYQASLNFISSRVSGLIRTLRSE